MALVGGAGTGKSFVASKLVEVAQANKLRVLIVTPTGALSDVFRRQHVAHPLVDVDTIDGAFMSDDPDNDDTQIFRLGGIDMVFVDEIGFTDDTRMAVIRDTWLKTGRRAMLLFAGDGQ